jgi:hypothetical protein
MRAQPAAGASRIGVAVVLCAACGSLSVGSAVMPTRSAVTPSATGTSSSPAATDANLVEAGYAGRFRAAGTVLEDRTGGPRLCLGAVLASLPPGCGGPRIIGWSWATVVHESASGVHWGSYDVVGRYDGTVFTLTEPAKSPTPASPSPSGALLATPCPAPAGGWRPIDPATTTNATLTASVGLARRQSGHAEVWVDRTVTTPWGGALCVSGAPRTAAELDAVAARLPWSPDNLSTWTDGRAGFVTVKVILANAQRQRQLDDRYGVGVVRLFGALQPID